MKGGDGGDECGRQMPYHHRAAKRPKRTITTTGTTTITKRSNGESSNDERNSMGRGSDGDDERPAAKRYKRS